MPRIISFLATISLILAISSLILITLVQMRLIALESSKLGLLERELQNIETEHQAKKIESSKIGTGFLSREVAKLNFEEVGSFNFISAEEAVAQK